MTSSSKTVQPRHWTTLIAVGRYEPRSPSGARISTIAGTRAWAPIAPATASIRLPTRQPTRIATSAAGSESAGTRIAPGDDHEQRDPEVPPEEARGRPRRAPAAAPAPARCPRTCRRASRPARVPRVRRTRSRRGRGRAPVRRNRARRLPRRRRRACASRPGPRRGAAHSSQPSAPARRGAPSPPGWIAMPSHIPIGGTPRAKCSASASCPAARSEIVHRPASRSSSWSAAWRSHEKATSGGSRESPTSVPSVSPSRCPPLSTVTTATPEGKRPSRARKSPASAIARSSQARRCRAGRGAAAFGPKRDTARAATRPPAASAARTEGSRRAGRTRARAACRAGGSRGTPCRLPGQ